MEYRKILLALMIAMEGTLCASAQNLQAYAIHPDSAFFCSDEAQRIGRQVLLWQRTTGGWPKNVDMVRPMTDSLRMAVKEEKSRQNDSTIDNGATFQQMRFLAWLYHYTQDKVYREAFIRGVEFLLSGQYPNGGWPQFWPERRGYQWHITYNDDAMVNTLNILRDIASRKAPFAGDITTEALRNRMQEAFDKGVECILATQIVVGGQPTIWCQQHDHETLLPAPARAYELASYCPVESAQIIRLLMELPHPSERVCRSIDGAMAWLEKHKLTGIRLENFRNEEGLRDVRVVHDAGAPPIWARFYDLQTEKPFFCDRDGIPRPELSLIGYERRTGYSWYNNKPAQLFPLYEQWKKRHGRG